MHTDGRIDFSEYAENQNAAEIKYRLMLYKRENRDHHAMFNRGANISRPPEIPSDDEEILSSERFRERYGKFLKSPRIDEMTIAKWRQLISNVGLEKILRIVVGDGDKWSATQTWHNSGEPDLFISKEGHNYFCEVKSPNDKPQKSQRDFMEHVAKKSDIDYIFCRVKPVVDRES